MKICVINRGSSSIKCSLYRDEELLKEIEAPAEKKGVLESFVQEGMDGIGHRIVHGGSAFTESVLITPEVKKKLRKLAPLAPLHNPIELEEIETLEKLFPNIPQVAVFDTAFHRTLPKEAYIYPGPYEWYEKGIRRYGFHGISFQYCVRRVFETAEKKLNRLVVCHLGSGASLCAVKEGKSIDTTMGFTPLEGLMMSTRSGTVDPGILLHLKGENLEDVLYNKSGLLGISGISGDMRDIIEQSLKGNERALLAWDIYLHRLCSLIGSMVASLGGIDGLVFTGGVGENSLLLREKVCERLSFLGKIQVFVIHTEEASEIARESKRVILRDVE